MGIFEQNLNGMNEGEIISVLKSFLPGCSQLEIDTDYLDWNRLDRIFVLLISGNINFDRDNIYRLVSIRKANESVMWKELIFETQLGISKRPKTVKVDTLISYIKKNGNI